MKVTKFLAAALFTFSFTFLSASNVDPFVKQKVRAEVVKFINNEDLASLEKKSFTVTFIINSNNEIIVSSTSDKDLDATFKSMLNYKKINVEGVKPYEVFTLPVVIK